MSRETWFIFVLLMSTQCLNASLPQTPVVYTNSGPVRGLISRTVWNEVEYSSFKGIPYAKPPTGSLRFKPPVPVKAWKQTLNAFQEGSVCPQMDMISGDLMGKEDCLFLNVFTPKTQFEEQQNLKSVMVWIHGGGYMTGYSNASMYGPDFFIEEDIVLVSFNYRLGALGFLSLDHPRATGNAGLKDQNLVLRWVQNNIANFGGDPRKVTIFGESAGATSVGFHILSEKSRGLFLRSISMSGVPLCMWAYHTPQEAINKAHKLAAILGFAPRSKTDLLNFFLRAPVSDLVIGTTKVDLDFLPFRPTAENSVITPYNSAFLTECPLSKYYSGKFYQHSMMLGFTRDEVLLFTGPAFGPLNATEKMVNSLENRIKHDGHTADENLGHIAMLLDKVANLTIAEVVKLGTDFFFWSPIDLTQRIMTKYNRNHPIYYYRVSYQTQYSMHGLNGNPLNGTAHLDDVGYIFNVKDLNAPSDPTDPFNQFRKRMVTLWTNFAKYGHPTPRNPSGTALNVTWTNSGDSGSQLDINEVFTMKDRLIDRETEVFEKSLHAVLPIISGCRRKPVDYKSIF
ncbi:juvenile hormone esterase-like [Hylaeus anthracinus]|uniref:juvenile hormone esterase-like n=1 Tax=Hylaeus anthracinus TaxID=313031 RepID=UPI0023B9C826|nr:juvenile hormone esterase-like [Hylaeus anthracinus]